MSINNLNNSQRLKPKITRLMPKSRLELSQTKSLVSSAAVVALATGGLLSLINYPLETIIVLIFAASIVSLSRM